MVHPEIDELRRWARGEPTTADGDEIAAHVATCDACRVALEAEARLDRVLRMDVPPELPAASVAQACARIDGLLRRDRARAGRRVRAAVYVLIGAGAVAAAIVTTPAGGARRFAATLPGVSREVELQAAQHAAALRVLAERPWVADDLETMIELRRLEAGGGADGTGPK